MTYYKYNEIKKHFTDWLEDQSPEWIAHNVDDIHYYAFNQDYYIIGYYKAEQWLGDKAFEVIGIVQQYEQDNFGEVTTDLSSSEAVVNMYAYIVGEAVVSEYTGPTTFEQSVQGV